MRNKPPAWSVPADKCPFSFKTLDDDLSPMRDTAVYHSVELCLRARELVAKLQCSGRPALPEGAVSAHQSRPDIQCRNHLLVYELKGCIRSRCAFESRGL